MVHSYLLDLYRVLAEREKEIEKGQEEAMLSPEEDQLVRGRLTALRHFGHFLHHNFHAKLPRRLQK